MIEYISTVPNFFITSYKHGKMNESKLFMLPKTQPYNYIILSFQLLFF